MISSVGLPGLMMVFVVVLLIVMFVVSFSLFMKKILKRQDHTRNIEARLDRLEKKVDQLLEESNRK
ncbi:hypothetical protein N780_08040 [Pontibacillus chungwhensis BH030062]|uniref:DUF4083 domain-containing protein n=1 Tax=Pontibacillus chungwhensis BH030062 TaxID=1385513 RepID=A0A0A2UXR5_9BACI|nr:DUF4083 family protein [Pontibacillus chungwhensis]KGP91296.1 hypothetical protein N780_08040 [Pontibacillus chungwhensis BH030062]